MVETEAGSSPVRLRIARTVIIVLLGVALIGALGFFGDEVGGLLAMRPWGASGPQAVLAGFVQAMRDGDPTRLESVTAPGAVLTEQQSGRIARAQFPRVRGMEMTPIERLAPADGAEDAPLDFDFAARTAEATVPLRSGGTLWVMMQRVGTAWKVTALSYYE